MFNFCFFRIKIDDKKSVKFYFMNIPIFSKKNKNGKIVYRFLGIPILKVINKFNIEDKLNTIEEHIKNLDVLCYKYSYFSSIVSQHHKKNLRPFKNIHEGKSIVICGTGPTYNAYKSVENAIHISLNRAFEKTDVKFDYIFAWDLPNLIKADKMFYNNIKEYPAKKIFGKFMCEDIPQINENVAEAFNAITVYSSAKHGLTNSPYDEQIHYDIENYPLMDFGSVAFGAFHFALYTGASKIYLVGIDNSLNGYFKDSHKQEFLQIDIIYNGWLKVKKFLEIYYPHIEVFSINPIGLRGIFKDVYTEKFLLEHPELNKDEVNLI